MKLKLGETQNVFIPAVFTQLVWILDQKYLVSSWIFCGARRGACVCPVSVAAQKKNVAVFTVFPNSVMFLKKKIRQRGMKMGPFLFAGRESQPGSLLGFFIAHLSHHDLGHLSS